MQYKNNTRGNSSTEKRISFTIERPDVLRRHKAFGKTGGKSFGRSSGARTKTYGTNTEGGRSYSSNYSQNFSGSRSTTRSSSPRTFGRSGGGGRSYGRGRSSGSRIDISKYISKAIAKIEEIFTPVHTFADFKADKTLLSNLTRAGIIYPTPIQDQAIPAGLAGSDIMGIAQTGTGKTLAFLLPIITKIINEKRKAIVLAPTRELATQIEKEFRNFTIGMRLWTHLVIGGSNMMRQIRQAKMSNDIVIGTPGRIQDLVNRGVLKLGNIDMVVLDEADRMLDMGFRDDIVSILNNCKKEGRQTFCFSATMSRDIEQIADKYLVNPVKIAVKKNETSANVDQDVIRYVGHAEKIEKLHEQLIKDGSGRVIIFCKTKSGTEKLQRELKERGFKSIFIHGDLRQSQRNNAIKTFKDGLVNVLIATDVASRGLDIKDVTHVINYDIPENHEDYTHRIGRTGRAGKKGIALTFVEGQ